MHGAGWSRITHPFATLTPAQAPGIPFDLHVLSTPPAFILSQNRTLHKKPCEDIRTMTPNIIDETVYKENDPHKTPTPITGPSATPNKGAGIGLAIKMTLQSSTNTLLSSQTTTAPADFLISRRGGRRAEQRDMNLPRCVRSCRSKDTKT